MSRWRRCFERRCRSFAPVFSGDRPPSHILSIYPLPSCSSQTHLMTHLLNRTPPLVLLSPPIYLHTLPPPPLKYPIKHSLPLPPHPPSYQALGQRHPGTYIVDVFKGSRSKAVSKHGHDAHPLHGCGGTALSKPDAGRLLRQLVVAGVLREETFRHDNQHGTIASFLVVRGGEGRKDKGRLLAMYTLTHL